MTPARPPIRPLIMAAGQGTRMRSALPKVLHRVCGRTMIDHVLTVLEAAGAEGLLPPVVVIGHGSEEVRAHLGPGVRLVEQAEQRGTGHAVMVALEALGGVDGTLLVLSGDAPLLTAATLGRLIAHHQEAGAGITLLSAHVDQPTIGRVLRDAQGLVTRIVEDQDASVEERAITEVNAGTYLFEARLLRRGLAELRPANAQGEYYLTDVVGWALARGERVEAFMTRDSSEALGVNSRRELAHVEGIMRRRLLDALMDGGVTILDPAATYVHAGVTVEPDTLIHPGTSLEGATRIGAACAIGPHARLVDALVGDGVTIVGSTVIQSTVGEGSRVGPYSHLRPNTRLGRHVEVGNFAELKNSTIGDHTKVHHKSYLGDATVGQRVNIGAGTVTCNLRDRSGQKWPTVIEDDAFIGSDSMLVAPVRIGRGAMTGAGSVVTRDVPEGAVAVGVPARVIRHAAGGSPRAEVMERSTDGGGM